MTKDDIIRMAKEAGFGNYTHEAMSMFEHFANLVAAAEREACAKLVEPDDQHKGFPSDYLGGEEGVKLLDCIAAAIRARSQS
jgi:hypothetical protein